MYKQNLLMLMIACSSLSAMDELDSFKIPLKEIDLTEATFHIPQRLLKNKRNKKLLFNKNGFSVKDTNGITKVHSHDTDKLFHDFTVEKMIQYSTIGKFKIREFQNGEYAIDAAGELKGGGVLGAWLGSSLGYGLITFAGHGTVLALSFLAGPAQPAAFLTLEKMFTIPIHSAACAAGVAGGVAAGVATGPV